MKPKSKRVHTNEVQITSAILNEIDDLCRINGVGALFVLNPSIYFKTNQIYNESNMEMLLHFLEKEQLNCIDLTPYFRRFLRNKSERLIFDFDSHWNENGHRLVSTVLIDYMSYKK